MKSSEIPGYFFSDLKELFLTWRNRFYQFSIGTDKNTILYNEPCHMDNIAYHAIVYHLFSKFLQLRLPQNSNIHSIYSACFCVLHSNHNLHYTNHYSNISILFSSYTTLCKVVKELGKSISLLTSICSPSNESNKKLYSQSFMFDYFPLSQKML